MSLCFFYETKSCIVIDAIFFCDKGETNRIKSLFEFFCFCFDCFERIYGFLIFLLDFFDFEKVFLISVEHCYGRVAKEARKERHKWGEKFSCII